MYCPKDRKTELVASLLSSDLQVKCCPDCKGTWLPATDYETWQEHQPSVEIKNLPQTLDVDFVQSPFDAKGALCPDCRNYLARAKVGLNHPFYVERCPNCGGIWCDYGEWEALEAMGLQTVIQRLFTSEWQEHIKEREHREQERRVMIEKLGEDLAQQLFDLAERLEKHPHGDYGVAYLMRRVDQ